MDIFYALGGFTIFSLIDFLAFTQAKYPQRSYWAYKIPGGGIVAYLMHRHND